MTLASLALLAACSQPQGATFTITDKILVPADRLEPIGANGFGDAGMEMSANNWVINPGNEPISIRKVYRVTNAGPNWVEVDRGGLSGWDLFRSGWLSGASYRIYRLTGSDGAELADLGQNTDLGKAKQADLVSSGVVPPKGSPGLPKGGFVCNRWTSPGNIGVTYYNTSWTDAILVKPRTAYYYSVIAVDSQGRESAPAAEVKASTGTGASNTFAIALDPDASGPDGGLFPMVKGQKFGEWREGFRMKALGATGSVTWRILTPDGKPFALPSGMSFDASSGLLSGTPTVDVPEQPLVIRAQDSAGKTDSRTFMVNPKKVKADSQPPLPPTDLRAVTGSGHVKLSWKASQTPNVFGYKVVRSEVPGAEQVERLYLSDSKNPPKKHDILVLSHKKTEIDLEDLSPRLPNRNLGFYWNGDGIKFSLAPFTTENQPHTGGAGESCLKAEFAAGSHRMFQYVFTGPKGQDSHWYSQLEPGKRYLVEFWAKGSGFTGSKVTFGYGIDDPGYKALDRAFTISEEWKKHSFSFTGPPLPVNQQWVFGHGFQAEGPGTLYLDNMRVSRVDSPADDKKAFVPHPDLLAEFLKSQPEGRKGTLRIYGPVFNHSPMLALLRGVNSSRADVSWMASVQADSGKSLPQSLEIALATGSKPESRVVPWITFQVTQAEHEWQALIEYLAEPFDPALDSGKGKPYAAIRFSQRGHGRPWTDDFREMILEIGNETWHNGAAGYGFEGFGYGSFIAPNEPTWGTEYGLMAGRFFAAMRSAPSWKKAGGKIKLAAGGFYDGDVQNGQPVGYSEVGQSKGMGADIVGHANYVGPKWETGDTPMAAFDAKGIQATLAAWFTDNLELRKKQHAAQQLLASRGIKYDQGAYEGGPSGYFVPGNGTKEQNEISQLYGKSLAMAIPALDAWLTCPLYGFTHQAFFGYGQGDNWNSHTTLNQGFRPTPGWLAMTLRNRHVSGGMVEAAGADVPVIQVGSTKDIPLIGVYAYKDGAKWMVFVVSRSGDATLPVTLKLPIASAKVTLHRLEGKPEDNNLKEMRVKIVSQDLGRISGLGSFRLEPLMPASIRLYVFEP